MSDRDVAAAAGRKNGWWRTIPGYDPTYEVSRTGKFRRVKGGRVRPIKPCVAAGGYLAVGLLTVDGRRKSRRIHQLVTAAFIGTCPPGLEPNHIDGDKRNNRVENLEYVTRSENLKHAAREFLRIYPKGDAAHNNRFPFTKVLAMRARYAAGVRTGLIAKEFGVSLCHTREIVRGRARVDE